MGIVTMQRKLAAIFSADVQGYSRLMGDDEEATIRTLTAYRDVMTQLIEQHRGRVVDAPGDNLLAEFASVVEAVRCAVATQRALYARNTTLPANRVMAFRIGINLGDVIVEHDRLYGEGVNLAARLQGLAEGGGICISGAVYDQVDTKLNLTYAFMGERRVKNMTKPVRVYRIHLEPECLALSLDTKKRLVLAPHRPVTQGAVSSALRMLEGIVTLWQRMRAVLFSQISRMAGAQKAFATQQDTPMSTFLPCETSRDDPHRDEVQIEVTEALILDLTLLAGSRVIFHLEGIERVDSIRHRSRGAMVSQ